MEAGKRRQGQIAPGMGRLATFDKPVRLKRGLVAPTESRTAPVDVQQAQWDDSHTQKIQGGRYATIFASGCVYE